MVLVPLSGGNRLACLAVHGIADRATILTFLYAVFLAMCFARTGPKAISKADWLIRLISPGVHWSVRRKNFKLSAVILLFTIAVDKFVDNL